jgi:hypothetical protein
MNLCERKTRVPQELNVEVLFLSETMPILAADKRESLKCIQNSLAGGIR